MADDFGIRGAESVDQLVKALRKHADGKALKKEFYSGLNRVSKPLRQRMKESTNDPVNLPTGGGLQGRMYGKQSVVASAKSGRNAGLRIVARSRKGGYDLGSVHRTGRLRHPVFGNRNVWVTQSAGVKPHWMDDTFQAEKPEIQRELLKVMNDVARKLTEGI